MKTFFFSRTFTDNVQRDLSKKLTFLSKKELLSWSNFNKLVNAIIVR